MPPLTQSPIVVEDGTIVLGSNSFVSIDDAAQFLFDRGMVKQNDIDDSDGGGLLRKGLDIFKGFDCLSDYVLPLDSAIDIPQALIEAQIWGAYYVWLGTDPAAPAELTIKREKVDIIEVEYQDTQGGKTSVSIHDMPNLKNSLVKLGCLGSNYIGRA